MVAVARTAGVTTPSRGIIKAIIKTKDNNTKDMIYNCATIISNLSKTLTLYPGDIIFTGTPQGVAYGEKNPKYLRAGDVVTMGIEGLGEQRNKCVAYK